MHPSSGITKEYVVTLNRQPRAQDLEAIAAGCTMDGVFVPPVAVIRDDTDASRPNRVRVVVAEGRNREVRGGSPGRGEGGVRGWLPVLGWHGGRRCRVQARAAQPRGPAEASERLACFAELLFRPYVAPLAWR